MITEKKFMPEIELYDYDGDLSKRWFIHWKENGKPVKKYKGINLHNTKKARRAAAKELAAYWLDQLNGRTEGFRGTKYNKQYKAIMRYLDRKKVTWRPKTIQQNENQLKLFLQWNQRHLITKDRLADFLNDLFQQRKKQNTVRNYYLLLRNIIGNALGQELFEGIAVKKGQGTPARYFSSSQIKFLSTQMSQKQPELWLAVRFIFYCFIRPGELRQLRVGDVMLDDGKICIPSDVSKNKKTQYVVIPDVFLEDLRTFLWQRNPTAYLIGGDFTPVGVNWMKNRHQSLLKKLHFDTRKYKLYSWKHTGAVVAVKSGIHIKQLQLQLRHHSLDQVNAYLRQLGVFDMGEFAGKMPRI